MINRQQAERKAMELYPYPTEYMSPIRMKKIQNRINKHRAAFMQCFDLMPTGSLPMTREEVEKWAEMGFDEAELRGAMSLYDHLASLSSAAQPATGYSEDQVRDAIRLAGMRAANDGGLTGYMFNPVVFDEIISSLNQNP